MYIYIHIPFCSSICHYCDFPKILYDKKYIEQYLDALNKEISSRYKGEVVKSIYIGGGTPTSLDYDELKILLDIIKCFKKDKDIEFTIESNIECLDLNKIRLLKSYGVNRVSLGVQSFNNNTLKELGRNHDKAMVMDLISLLKKEGISNISIDYIYGVNSNFNELKEDIDEFLKLDIPHVSCYSLIIEDGTLFGINNRCYIDDNIEYDMYKYIDSVLSNNDYYHYEISNYTKLGYESIHNLNYWNNGFYYGFGMGAVSYLDNVRIINTKNFTKYLNLEFLHEEIYEDIDTRISNELILGFRKLKGISIKDFNDKYKKDILKLFNIKDLLKDGKLEIVDGYLRISFKYFYLANEILVHFI